MDFCHLHVHSDYSLLDGAAKVDRLAARAADLGMSALALTDHGNMFGAVDFYRAATKHGIKPIVGVEAYIAPGRRQDRVRDPVAAYHLTLLAKDRTGYQNLLELVTRANMDGFYYYPRIDKDLLEKHHDGLIAMSGCLKGEVNFQLRADNRRKAMETADWYRSLFGEDYFLEVMQNGIDIQEQCNEGLRDIARELRIPLVATNDVHYLEQGDALAQECLLCLHTGKTLADKDRMRMSTQAFYFRDPEEMCSLFSDMPEAIDNTNLIASRCNLEITFGEHHLPHFDPPDGRDADTFFRDLCDEGLRERYPEITPEVTDRLGKEREIIESMGFVSYFLICWDFIRFARESDIPVGPGRGSAAGSIIAYALGITDVDPLKYDLLFERFLNSERVSMPDIDIDFCRDGREEVIRYVHDKYGGDEHVCQIVTFGTMAARAVLRDVGRVLDIPLPQVDMIAKKIPAVPGTKLGDSIERDPELKELREKDPDVRRLFDISLRLEGLNRHCSTHAAGVVIGDQPLKNYVALNRQGDDITTQYTMEDLERIGLLKMDFLGLKTLTVIDKALALVEQTTGKKLDPRKDIPDDDPAMFAMLQRGEALGIFQLESEGMRELLKKMKPDCFEDLIAILALYRPGPLGSGMVDSFVRRKHGEEEVTYPHEVLEPILSDTYGTLVYQEQIMLIANRMSGFSMNEADSLRKAMGKKKEELMAKFRPRFVDGAAERGVPTEVSETIWEQMTHFAKYCFNKSHTTAYAVVTNETAWLKAHYPVEFMAALMTCDMGNTDKVVRYLGECRRMGIEVLSPDINVSSAEFTAELVEGDGKIRFGLGAVKGVGLGAIQSMVTAREEQDGAFRSLFEFAENVDHHVVNRAAVEALIKAGCFDTISPRRAAMTEALGAALKAGQTAQRDRDAGQMGLFGGAGGATEPEPPTAEEGLPDVPDWPEPQVLAFEKETLGFYITSHPLSPYEEIVRAFSTASTASLADGKEGQKVVIGGMFTEVRETYPRQGRNKDKKMALITLEDFEGSVNGVIFCEPYAKCADVVEPEGLAFIEGTLDLNREDPSVKIDRVIPIERAYQELAGSVTLAVPDRAATATIQALKELLEGFPGRCPIYLDLSPTPTLKTLWKLPATYSVLATPRFVEAVEGLLGKGAVVFSTTQAPVRAGSGMGQASRN
ncbi:MAG: DNA polymerase III subunit alpha [Planctomycetota bacterium]